MVSITTASVYVDDQDKALAFYTEVLGFIKKADMPVGGAKWLTVAPAAAPDGVVLLLEPNGNPNAKNYQEGIFEAGIPAATFATDDIHKELERMSELGVVFRGIRSSSRA